MYFIFFKNKKPSYKFMKDRISGKCCVKVELDIFCCISVINQDHVFRVFIKGGALDN